MTDIVSLSGRVESGQGVGASFTRTDWALGMFRDAYGVDPFPGTLNVRADPGPGLLAWRRLAPLGRLFEAPDPAWCDARCLRATILHRSRQAPAVVVVPMVADYPRDQIELVAAVRLRHSLALVDGSAVVLEFLAAGVSS